MIAVKPPINAALRLAFQNGLIPREGPVVDVAERYHQVLEVAEAAVRAAEADERDATLRRHGISPAWPWPAGGA